VDDSVARVDVLRSITVLSVSRFGEDHLALERAFHDSEATLYPGCTVRITCRSEPAAPLSIMRCACIPIVVCDAGGQPDSWERMARELKAFSEPSCLILASKLVSDLLCREAAKHGAYDVVAKP
jgi:hypothetical protein